MKILKWGILFVGGKWDFWKPWVTLKTPVPPLLSQFTEHWEGCLTAILSLSSECTFNYSMPVYALFNNRHIIMYMCQPIIPSKKENLCFIFYINLRLKRMHFMLGKLSWKKENK